MKLAVGSSEALICNVYIPNDSYSANNVDARFMDVCDQIEMMIGRDAPGFIILGGDFNVDFKRNNAHTQHLISLMYRNLMANAWMDKRVDTYIATNMTARSQIDHFLCSDNVMASVKSMDVLKLHDNMSNHQPINLDLDLAHIQAMRHVETDNAHLEARIAWHKVMDLHVDNYQKHLDRLLKAGQVPAAAYCLEFHFVDTDHRHQIDD